MVQVIRSFWVAQSTHQWHYPLPSSSWTCCWSWWQSSIGHWRHFSRGVTISSQFVSSGSWLRLSPPRPSFSPTAISFLGISSLRPRTTRTGSRCTLPIRLAPFRWGSGTFLCRTVFVIWRTYSVFPCRVACRSFGIPKTISFSCPLHWPPCERSGHSSKRLSNVHIHGGEGACHLLPYASCS